MSSSLIRLLPDAIANQIAAGEVVQRPASAVKELLENAVDAGSTHIQLIVRDGGKTLIQVIDDGTGMSETDARMSFERHATSKIRSTEDLFTIRTMGFRGEALASIAAVAQVEMRTRRPTDELGTRLCVEGSQLKTQETVATLPGTNVCVKNLFFNVPARRNFLKSTAVEMRHVLDEFQRIALAHPEIRFALYQNDSEVYNLPAGKLSARIVGLFGKNYREQIAPCGEETDFVKVNGYLGKPEFAKRTRGEQFFFVNNRYVRHAYLHHAVMGAFENLLPESAFPFYVLFIEIDPVHIDINVHPTKTEIKFDDERAVYSIVNAAVKRALGANHLVPPMDFSLDVNFGGLGSTFTKSETSSPGNTSHFPGKTPLEKSNQQNWAKLYEDFQQSFRQEHPDKLPEESAPTTLTFESRANPQPVGRATPAADLTTVFQVQNRFVVTRLTTGMVLIDQQAAHERILFEKYQSHLQNGGGVSQQLLFPQEVDFNPADVELLVEAETEIRALGFQFTVLGKSAVVVNGIPADAALGSEKELLEGLIEQFKWHQIHLHLERSQSLARALARRAATKPGVRLAEAELTTLVESLFATTDPYHAPDGRLAVLVLDTERILGLFRGNL